MHEAVRFQYRLGCPTRKKPPPKFFAQHGIDAVEIAPTKYWPAPVRRPRPTSSAANSSGPSRNVPIRAMQSLLFGMPNLNIFQPAVADETLRLSEAHLANRRRVGRQTVRLRIAEKPRSRPAERSADANRLAADFFRPLAESAHELGVVFCLEPNPAVYQCNFMTNTAEALAVVDAVDHPGLGLHLDSGIMCLNGESFEAAIAAAGPRLSIFMFRIRNWRRSPTAARRSCRNRPLAAGKRLFRHGIGRNAQRRKPGRQSHPPHAACEVLNRHYRH